MEVRLHGRGGQGGVTCAKILAATWAHLGMSVQAFGDYSGERSGAPVRAYLRVDSAQVVNRNKVYTPDHVLVLDHALCDGAAVLGLKPGGTLIVNTLEAPADLAVRFPGFRIATVDATGIARTHGIGTRSVVIVNTTIAGAFARIMGLPIEALEAAFTAMHVERDLSAARAAWDAVLVHEAVGQPNAAPAPAPSGVVLDLVDQVVGLAPTLRTGAWRSSRPVYHTRPAPCSNACPAGNDVVGFTRALATDGPEAAAAILAKTSPFASVCGRVCAGYCGHACNRDAMDEAVNTRGLERWIGDHAGIARADRPQDGRRAAVIGAGPAGISAAYQLARAGWRVDLIDGAERPGGLLRSGIPPWRLPRDVLDREVDAVIAMGVRWQGGRRVGPADLPELAARYDALVLAAGQTRVMDLDVPGRSLNGIEQGLDFLHDANLGLACQLSGHVVVIGGGNTAMDCARSALRRGADKVTVVYRRTRDQMPAIPEEVEEAEEEGVQFRFLRAPLALYGDDAVGGIELGIMDLDPNGGAPALTEQRDWIACDSVILAIGQRADPSALLPTGWTIRHGQVHNGDEALPVFATGDLATGEGTVAHAIGDGARIATRARAWFKECPPPGARPHGVVRHSEMRFSYFDAIPRLTSRMRPAAERVADSSEVNLGIPAPQEADRCMSCGHCTHCDTCLVYCPEGIILRVDGGYAADLTQCKGCGVCARECPRASIEMVAE